LSASQNDFENRLDLGQDFVVPKAYDAPAATLEIFAPPPVVFFLIRVLASVELDDESAFGTREVGIVATDRMLPTELEAAQSPVA